MSQEIQGNKIEVDDVERIYIWCAGETEPIEIVNTDGRTFYAIIEMLKPNYKNLISDDDH